MERQEPQPAAVAATTGVEEAPPPAYSPNAASASGARDANVAPAQPPAPVKDLPTDLNQQPAVQPQMVPQQPLEAVTPLNRLGGISQWIHCPFCQQRTRTRVEQEGSGMQIVAGGLLCLFCVCLACLPCVCHWFEETNYYCSQCNRKVASKPGDDPIIVFGPVKATQA